jgi:hypothetical protein
MLPNANVGGAIPMGMESGVLHGYVSGSGGLPWYEGRAIHIHVKVRTFEGAEEAFE